MNPLDQMRSLDATKKAFSFWEEFKNFAFKGNVIDLAIGVIIGAAFGSIIKSLVDHIIMPLIGAILPGQRGFEGWVWHIGEQTIPYGLFLGTLVNFLLVAIALWIFIVKFLGWVMKSKKEQPPPAPTKDQELLMEIRDLLKQDRAK
jgi:large conductance mechanosensitive channel